MANARLLLLTGAALLVSCKGGGDFVGTFGGDWNAGPGVADAKAKSESEVTITKKEGDNFDVKIDTPFMSCTMTSKLNGENELYIVGPETVTHSPDTPLDEFQHCTFTGKDFRGEAHVRGKVFPKPGGSIAIVLTILPLSTPTQRVPPATATIGNFIGNRGRTVRK